MINGKKILRISAKIIVWLIGIFIFLFATIWIVLKVPSVQNFLVTKATSYIHNKTHTRVELKYIDIGFPKSILLQGIFLEDQQHDTLLSTSELEVDVNMLALFNHTISVQSLTLDKAYVRLIRNERDSTFNFQFLLDVFTGKDTKTVVADTSASIPWTIKANHVSLNNFKFDMIDSLSGLKVFVTGKNMKAGLNKLDLQKSSVDLSTIRLEETHTNLFLTKNQSSDTTTSSAGWNKIELAGISIDRSSFSFTDEQSNMQVKALVGEFELESTSINLIDQTIKSEGILIANTSSSIKLAKDKTPVKNSTIDTSVAEGGWKVELASLEMKQNNFQMDVTNEKNLLSGIDWNHLSLTSISTYIKDILYTGSIVNANIESLAVQEKSGLGVVSLQTKAHLNSTEAELSDLTLTTNYSHLGQHIKVEFTSLDQLMSSLSLNCSMHNNYVAMREILLLVPELDTVEIIHKNRDRIVHFNLDAQGSLKQLAVKQFSLKTLTSSIEANGNINFITDPDKLYMDLGFKKIQSGAADIAALLPDSTIPASIQIPDTLTLTGNHKGSLSDFKTKAIIESNIGNASVEADIKDLRKKLPAYSILLNANDFDLGKLLGQNILGKLNGTVEVIGKGLDSTNAKANIKADIASLGINAYNYHAITLEGTIDKGLVTAQGNVADTNLILSFDTHVNIKKGQELYDLKLNLKGADFYGLGFTSDHVSLTANTDLYLTGDPTKKINGHITTRNILVIKNGKKYKSDSLVFVSVNEGGKTAMKLNSSMLGASFDGNIDVLSVGPAITNHLNRYFQLADVKFKKTNPQNFNFELQLNDSPLLREVIFPSLTDYNPLHIKGSFNSEEARLTINGEIPFATYDNMTVNNLALALNSDAEKLDYSASWNYFKTAGITIQNTKLDGKVAHDTVSINLQIKNKDQQEKILLHTYLTQASKDHYRFSIFPNGLSLEGKNWTVAEKNYIEFGTKYVFANQFKFTQDKQSIHLQSSAEGDDMALNFSSFNLHTFSQIVEDEDLLMQGIMDGDVQLKNFLHNPAFTSELKIKDLIFKKSRIGNLHITADNLTAERYTAKVILTDSINKATINGYYLTSQGNDALHFNANIELIQLASLEAFSGGQISGSDGFVKGDIAISGAVKDPKFNGDLQFVNASTKVTYLNQRLSMKKEKISISPERVTFNSFKIADSLNNEAIINGYAGIKSFSDITFNLNITTNDFMILNTTAVNNKLYYGKVILDSKITVRGTKDLPIIKADINIVRGSHFTVAVPDSKISVDRGDGVVVFTNDSSSLDPIMLRQQDDVSSDKITGLDITANVSINRNSTLKILVDPIAGDSLSVKGDADLNFRMDASGQTSLNGRYVVSEGSYKASLENLLVRKFQIVKGSTIIWNGELLEALIDISATYSTKTAPEGLLANTPVIDSAALRKPLPFIVVMMMKGELMKPIISFKLDMPDNAKGAVGGEVYSKITTINADESEINKQVFALLVLNRFIAPDNSGGAGGASSFARRSVSRMMSNELNKLSSKYVNGLQIDVDVQSYNDINNGQQQGNTQVEVGVTKSLLDERLNVQVGTNVALEGQNANSSSNAKNFTGDVIVEYKLTKSGRYKVKAFRTNQYDGISNGTIIQTGVGLIYTRNFTHVRDLFTSRRRREKK